MKAKRTAQYDLQPITSAGGGTQPLVAAKLQSYVDAILAG